jgi:diguanylate cyclase (GGDEF)-like protein
MVMALFVDVDGLKAINDEHGHAAGDEALRLTAEALRATTRQSDVVARIGGDEFLVTSIAVDRIEVELLAERIRTAVATRTLSGGAVPIPLRCSIGMALSGSGAATVDALIHRADSGLYAAKRRGRDQARWDDETDIGDLTAGVGPTRRR